MNLKEQVRQSLDGLTPFDAGAHLLEATDGGQQLRCKLVALDRLACAFEALSLKIDDLAGANTDRLKQVAERLSARLTYLLEPISPIEIDSHGCIVQMRSNPPQKEADRTTYYELLVEHTGELSLRRYTRTSGTARTTIAAEVTREVLMRLVGDFSAAT
jgi:hypothetical protein